MTFDDKYKINAISNYQVFMQALKYLHQIIDTDGSSYLPTVDLVASMPADGDYGFAYQSSISQRPFGNPAFFLGKNWFCINSLHNWISYNLGHFVATAVKRNGVWGAQTSAAGFTNLPTWNSQNIGDSYNLFEYIGVVGRDENGNQSGFTRMRPAWIYATTGYAIFDDHGGNTNNVPVIGDVARLHADGLKYRYAGGGNWSYVNDQHGTPVRVLTGCGNPGLGDYCGHPIFWNELYKALKELRWTFSLLHSFPGVVTGAAPGLPGGLRSGLETSLISEDNAKALALSDYATESAGPVATIYVRSGLYYHKAVTSPSWAARIEKARGSISANLDVVATTAPLGLARKFEFYYKGLPIPGIPLDSLGTGIDISGNIVLWRSEGPTAAPKTSSTVSIPDANVTPAWPTAVTVDTSVEFDREGGCKIFPYIVFKWDVPGGLPYLAGVPSAAESQFFYSMGAF